MPIATFRGERSVDEITDKLYTGLTDRQREKARAAMLEANPQLATIDKVRNGSVLRVPRLPELRAKTNRSLENPDAQVALGISDALADYRKSFALRVKQSQASVQAQTKLAGSAGFKRALEQHAGAGELASAMERSLKQRATILDQRAERFERALERVVKDLDKGPG
jgi:hypothetical protein